MSSSHEVPDIFHRLLGRRVVFIRSPLDGVAADLIIAQLLHLESQDPTAGITVRINCAQAELAAALAVYDILQTLQAPVGTLCSGTAAGGAALLLAAGQPGRRLSLPSGRILLQHPRGKFYGSSRELDAQSAALRRLCRQMNELLARHTGQPLERIERDTEHGLWLSAEEACAYGLIDRVIARESGPAI
ncbi:MAG: ATP-dependent Clp protease proteolytic subunit [Armatimonadota bacterium]|nr:ATP-dependent Clp protease proteolytic subunit [Armatimonadota bacterium]MDR7450275.1 ATP-dependent Clp protease proteolytic subunit [Armatimonadota bacterium]MDR7467142.1 ATP-dependent Clp protease proteolytic subunit [Armatimonadota bacterium]MDR7493316.1 ATP-dependent Clp protease proteolytic subunit [Armatimonadota bacterium]MDR7499324.1 ATP-dependent Clp protease proteolytic subunit [Armatimonadota bacterium]